jgi:SAM-dependent methyltransferase
MNNTTPLLINLGCGARWSPRWSNLDGGSWAKRLWLRTLKVVRSIPLVDRALPARFRRYPRDVVVWNMRKVPLPYPTGSAAAIFSQYSFEYLSPAETSACLKDCRRVLAPGGVIRLCQTDIAGIVASYLAEDLDPSPRAIARARRVLESVGGGEHLKLSVRLLHGGGHRQLFDAPSLEWMLRDAGFTDVRFVEIHEGECPDLETLEGSFGDIPIIRVEAHAPGAM